MSAIAPAPPAPDKGLKSGALGFASNVVIGVASTAPGYSLAAVLGFVVAIVGFQAPAVLIVAFLPIFCIAMAYRYMNAVDPDCGTTFTWVTRAFGPSAGWLGGWAIIVADIIVMANLAAIAGRYTFLLLGADGLADSLLWVTTAGVIWIVVMTVIVTIGIELSARSQMVLLSAEVVTLVVFAAVALAKADVTPELSWFSPFAIEDSSALLGGVLLAVFIYWGWDSGVVVNEESENPARTGAAGVVSTLILIATYVIVAVAALAFAGVEPLADNDDVLSALGTDVLGSPWDNLVIIAVLTSAAASTQTTILPTARTALSMAFHGAFPRRFASVHPRFLTPHVSTITMGALSIVWYVGLTLISEELLLDAILALGLMIAFYYGLTGFACAWYYRRRLTESPKLMLLAGILPTVGGVSLFYLLYETATDLADPELSTGGSELFGLGLPLVIGIFFLLLGIVLMLVQRRRAPEFFRRRAEVLPPS